MTPWILLRNETIKTTRRFAFWVTLLAFSGICTLMLIDAHQASLRTKNPRPFELPSAWWQIFEDPGQMAMFFGSVILVLLVASEFSWRTARQNVIDGLSREQFFLGKLMLLPMIVAVMLLVPILVGPPIAMIGEGAPAGGWISVGQVQMAGAVGLAMLGMASLAFFFATTIRNTGSALAVFILYAAFVERIFGMLLAWMNETWAPARRYLPTATFQGLVDARRWQPGFESLPLREGQLPPVPTVTLVGFVIGWTLLLWGLSFLIFRKRDL